MPFRRRLLFFLFAALALPAAAQTYPDKPIKLVVAFPAAGTTDIIARIMAERASQLLGQQMIVDNRPGAGGNLGTALVARAPADGYTLSLCTIGTCAINPSIFPRPGYDLTKDFAPVILVGEVINVLAINNEVPARSVKDLVTLAKAKPGTLTYGSSGYGSSPHLSGELLKSMAGIDMVHIPYKGSAPAIIDLRGGQIQMFFDNVPSILPHVKGGALRALATTGGRRAKVLPEVPTMEESGFPGFVIAPWWGVLAPARTPPAVVARLNQVFNQVLADPAVTKRFEELGLDVRAGTAQQLAAHIRSESAKWGKLVRERNIRAD
jgi:tripartite-type tricarboxylate transporter receptor subunit TctC